MTVCDICGKPMKITTATFDLGDGLDEIDVEGCKKCKILYVESTFWTLRKGD